MLPLYESMRIETILELESSLPACESIGSWATTLTTANLALFAGFMWIWERRTNTAQGSFVVFTVFMLTHVLCVATVVLAALGLMWCRVTFCTACVLYVPLVLYVWVLLRKYGTNWERLESKLGDK